MVPVKYRQDIIPVLRYHHNFSSNFIESHGFHVAPDILLPFKKKLNNHLIPSL